MSGLWDQEQNSSAAEEEESVVLTFSSTYLIIKVILCILIVANNTVLITVICRFKKLRTKTNNIILNFAVISLSYSIIDTVDDFQAYFGSNVYVYLIVSLVRWYFVILSILLAVLLGVDWYIIVTCNNSSEYQKRYKWIITAYYVLTIIICLSFYIAGRLSAILNWISPAVYLISFLIIAIINITKCCRRFTEELLKYAYILTVANIYFILWLIYILASVVYVIIVAGSNSPSPTWEFVVHFFDLLNFIAPILMTFTLVRREKNFKISYYAMFRKSGTAYEQEESHLNGENTW